MTDGYEARLVVFKADKTEEIIPLDTNDSEGGLNSASHLWYNELCTPKVLRAVFQYKTASKDWTPVCEFQNGPDKNWAGGGGV